MLNNSYINYVPMCAVSRELPASFLESKCLRLIVTTYVMRGAHSFCAGWVRVYLISYDKTQTDVACVEGAAASAGSEHDDLYLFPNCLGLYLSSPPRSLSHLTLDLRLLITSGLRTWALIQSYTLY